MSDVPDSTIIIGGGVIGLSLAYELAGQGRAVRVLEQGQFGREASWAGAGILPPGNLESATTPEARLRSLSHRFWPKWTEDLRDATGIDNGYRNCGSLEVRTCEELLDNDIYRWRNEGVSVNGLPPRELAELEPQLSGNIKAAFHLPQTSQVRNPRHLKALIAGCVHRGVDLAAGQPVTQIEVRDGRVHAVCTATERYTGNDVCITSGAWTRSVLQTVGIMIPVVPVRGQIVLLSLRTPLFRHIIECGPRYLVPRPDGRVLIGSTEERVGFDKRNTAGAIRGLIDFAVSLVPKLADATLERTWAGLRPCTADGLPYLGAVPHIDNLFVAAGHFRAGLQMSPGTALAMAEIMTGEPPPIDMAAYAIDRPVPAEDTTESEQESERENP